MSYQGDVTISFAFLCNETSDSNPADVAATLNRLPETLSEAVEALEKDKVLHELLGQNLIAAITGVRKVHYCSLVPGIHLQITMVLKCKSSDMFSSIFNRLRSSIIRRTRMHVSNSFTDTKRWLS